MQQLTSTIREGDHRGQFRIAGGLPIARVRVRVGRRGVLDVNADVDHPRWRQRTERRWLPLFDAGLAHRRHACKRGPVGNRRPTTSRHRRAPSDLGFSKIARKAFSV